MPRGSIRLSCGLASWRASCSSGPVLRRWTTSRHDSWRLLTTLTPPWRSPSSGHMAINRWQSNGGTYLSRAVLGPVLFPEDLARRDLPPSLLDPLPIPLASQPLIYGTPLMVSQLEAVSPRTCAPPLHTSVPAPPVKASSPLSPLRVSLPSPPLKVSLPAPPQSTSLPP